MQTLKTLPKSCLDVVILGAGSAGLAAQKEVSKITKNYIVIDQGPLGTTCARVGCMPSKSLIQVAQDWAKFGKCRDKGFFNASKPIVDVERVFAHVRGQRDRFVNGVLKSMESWAKEHLYIGKAYFDSNNDLWVDEQRVDARRILLATGSTPVVPGAWRDLAHLLNSDTLFELDNLPKKMAVIGTGTIGLEIGQALAQLGVQISFFGKDIQFSNLTDPSLLKKAEETFSATAAFYFGSVELHSHADGVEVQCHNHREVYDQVFLSLGRSPNFLGLSLDLEDFSPETGRLGKTKFYLAGDMNRYRALLHEAADEGRIAGYNMVRPDDQCFRRRVPLSITFTSPNIAVVGESYRDLKGKGIDFEIGTVSFETQGRSLTMMENKGMLSVYGSTHSGRLLGAEIFAPRGEHMAHLLTWAIAHQATVKDMLSMPFYHPVVEEGLRTALRDLSFKLAHPPSPLEILRCQDSFLDQSSEK